MTVGTVLLDTNVFTAWLKPSSTLVRIVAHDAIGLECPGLELLTELSPA